MKNWLFLITFLLSILAHAQPIDIIFWHSLTGQLGEQVEAITTGFNNSQTHYRILPYYKGEYTDALTSFTVAFRAHQQPAILQVFEVGSAIVTHPQGIIKPLADILQEQHLQLPVNNFQPAVREFYSKAGRLQAMPFNVSIPVIYYNASLLKKIGINADHFPKNWDDFELLLLKLKKQGLGCGYTTAYPSWIQIESYSALNNLYSRNALQHHLTQLKFWQQQGLFEYGGRANDATALFTSGHCALFSQSSGSYNSLKAGVDFALGVAAMPVEKNNLVPRFSNSVGGGALWAVAGQSDEVYKGIALFYRYLAMPSVQKNWNNNTGYIPIILTDDSENNPILNIAKADLAAPVSASVSPLDLPQNQLRLINDEVLEAIFSSLQTPEQALKEADIRFQSVLQRFKRNTGNQ